MVIYQTTGERHTWTHERSQSFTRNNPTAPPVPAHKAAASASKARQHDRSEAEGQRSEVKAQTTVEYGLFTGWFFQEEVADGDFGAESRSEASAARTRHAEMRFQKRDEGLEGSDPRPAEGPGLRPPPQQHPTTATPTAPPPPLSIRRSAGPSAASPPEPKAWSHDARAEHWEAAIGREGGASPQDNTTGHKPVTCSPVSCHLSSTR